MRVTEGVAASHKLALALKQHTYSLVARTPPVASRASPLAEGALDTRFIARSTVVSCHPERSVTESKFFVRDPKRALRHV